MFAASRAKRFGFKWIEQMGGNDAIGVERKLSMRAGNL